MFGDYRLRLARCCDCALSLFAAQMEDETVRHLDGEVLNENFFDNSNLVIYTYLL